MLEALIAIKDGPKKAGNLMWVLIFKMILLSWRASSLR
jgi:hypothetical protein